MRRWVAVAWHASFSIIAAGLYFAFVLPRWWELTGETPHTLGTVFRIVAGALIGLAALPVVFTLQRTRRPEYNTPRLALNLRITAIVLHVLAGVLIVGAAISEIWLSLDSAGPWLFGIYGAAAAIALLGVFSFYLAYVAEMPPPPPKPLKPKTEKQRRGRKKAAEAADGEDAAEGSEEDVADTASDEEAADDDDTPSDSEDDGIEPAQQEPAEVTAAAEELESTATDEAADDVSVESTNGKLRNRRPSTKDETTRRKRRRLRGGVAVED
jgi:hypothetical protein